jgi:hypothetical protein
VSLGVACHGMPATLLDMITRWFSSLRSKPEQHALETLAPNVGFLRRCKSRHTVGFLVGWSLGNWTGDKRKI